MSGKEFGKFGGPKLLELPPKLQAVVTQFNDYKIIIIEGGRVSGKSQGVARILLYIMQACVVRIIAGREVQNTIEESVYTIFVDIIRTLSLAFSITKNRIRCLTSGSTVGFKGFRERGAINIKGIEGADIVWVDEAQALTKPTIDALIPTLRKEKVKFIFTLNRLLREDAVMALVDRADCLHIHIDYFENPFCPDSSKDEAEMCRLRSERDYQHIWLGQPVKAGDEYIFPGEEIYAALKTTAYGDLYKRQRVMGIDWAAQGSDKCVASILERKSAEHWALERQVLWDEPNTVLSVGRITQLIGEWKPDVVIIDIGGGGWNVYQDLINAPRNSSITIVPFDGGSTKGISPRNINQRADGYWNLLDFFEKRWLIMSEGYKGVLVQLERIKRKFRGDGRNQVREKLEYKQDHGHSPDEADSLMMAVYGIRYVGKQTGDKSSAGSTIQRVTGSRRR